MYWDGSGKEENGNYFQKLPMYQAPARNIALHEFRSLNHRRCLSINSLPGWFTIIRTLGNGANSIITRGPNYGN